MSKRRHLVILCCCLLAFNAQGDDSLGTDIQGTGTQGADSLETDSLGADKEERSRLKSLKEQIIQLKEALLNRTSEIDQLAEQLQQREIATGEIRARLHDLEQDISGLEEDLSELEKRRQELEQLSLEQQAMIAREMNAAYRLGQSEPIKVLLNQEDPYKLARIIKYYEYFAGARREKIDQLEKTIAELDTVQQDITGKQNALLKAKEDNATQLAELGVEQEKRRQLLGELSQALKDDKDKLGRLKRERKQLEDLIASLDMELNQLAPATSEPFNKLKGKLPWPISGKVSQPFGSTRTQSIKWSGWLIDSREGDAVKAVHNGRVIFSDYFRGHGLMIIVDHGDGYLSLYAHNQLLLKEVGDWVQGGDTLAQAGSSGGLPKSALYFEIRHNGKPQNPKLWLRAQS